MSASLNFVSEKDLKEFLVRVSPGALYGSYLRDEAHIFGRIDDLKEVELGLRLARSPVTAKTIFTPLRERVAVYPSKDYPWEPEIPEESLPTALGLRGCDLRALEFLDRIFLEDEDEVEEPFYAARRKNTIIITTDCAEIAPSCFCTLLDDSPYPEKGFDINLSPIEAGFVVEAGSEQGKELLVKAQSLIHEATDEQAAQRDAMRQSMIDALAGQNADYKFAKSIDQIVTEGKESEKWDKLVVPCVECGACTQICPTCYCFYLYDQSTEYRRGLSERVKGWDSCLYADYSKMAGAGGMKPTPRPTLANRLRHRFLHKYSYVPEKYNVFGCTGCGRCIDACSGAIDVREVIKELGQ